MGTVGKVITGFVGIILLIFVLELVNLGFFGFFAPKYEDIRREVFENTQSYTHGKIQDLARRYHEWRKADLSNNYTSKTAIEEMIRMEFAMFDETKIDNKKLREFLIKVRGF